MKIPLTPVDSNQIYAIGHDRYSEIMAVQFISRKGGAKGPGAIYHYAAVTSRQYAEFEAADSKGAYFNAHFKDKLAFPYERQAEETEAEA